jgi:hypothetical protein
MRAPVDLIRSSWIVLVAGMSTGCFLKTPYVKAAAPYAGVLTSSAAVLKGELRDAEEICRRRAELDALRHWLEARPSEPTPATDWAAACRDVATAGDVHQQALRALAAYGEAIRTFATGDAYDGSGLEPAGEAIDGLVQKLAGSNSAAATYGKSAAAPVQQLTAFLFKEAVDKTLGGVVRGAAPSVASLLAAQGTFLSATARELAALREETSEVLDEAQLIARRGGGGGPNAAVPQAIAFDLYGAQERLDRALATYQANQRAYSAIVAALGSAQAALAKAQDDDPDDALTAVRASIRDARREITLYASGRE